MLKARMMSEAHLPPEIADWFAACGWTLRDHQLDMLRRDAAGEHVLLLADTGAGKTLAGFLPTLAAFAPSARGAKPPPGLHTLYVSPLKALAHDVRRNLLKPIDDMGLPVRVEARSGDTPQDRKKRQRADPPEILVTTPESLALLLSYPESFTMFATLQRVIIDEVHAFAPYKRGDLLSLSLSRLQTIAPAMRRTALSATVGDPQAFQDWIAPVGEPSAIIRGSSGPRPDISIMLPQDERVPWAGHAGRWAIPQVMQEIARHRTTLIFANTRFLAEYLFQLLWQANDARLPIGIHHGSLSVDARRKVEEAMARGDLRALVATSSLDLGVDWGAIDCVIQMGAVKGSSRLVQRVGRGNHRLECPSKAILVPGNRFEFLEAVAAKEAIESGQRDSERFRSGALDVLAQHLMGCACAGPFNEMELLAEIRKARPYASIDQATLERVLEFVATGGYALKAYDRFSRITRQPCGTWRLAHPSLALRHRLNAGIIVESEMINVRFGNGRSIGKVEDSFAAQLAPGDRFAFAGMNLEVEMLRDGELVVRATTRSAVIPSYMGQRMALTSHLAARVRALLNDRNGWTRLPSDVREWLEMQELRSVIPRADELLVETFPHEGRHYTVFHTFEGWNANQALGLLVTRRMAGKGLAPEGFVASDYALAVWSGSPIEDPVSLLSADILADEFMAWVQESSLLRRAFREVAIISGLIERQQPGARKSGRQITFSTDLVYDVLRKYEPEHVLLEAAWSDARERIVDIARLADILEHAAERVAHVRLERVSPLAVPALAMIGQERTSGGHSEDGLLLEAEVLAKVAMASG